MLQELNIPFVEDVGEAAFYGPKVDINAKNVYGKEDTMITIQWDALLAEQFDMYYIDENGEKQRPYIIHRTFLINTMIMQRKWKHSLKKLISAAQ